MLYFRSFRASLHSKKGYILPMCFPDRHTIAPVHSCKVLLRVKAGDRLEVPAYLFHWRHFHMPKSGKATAGSCQQSKMIRTVLRTKGQKESGTEPGSQDSVTTTDQKGLWILNLHLSHGRNSLIVHFSPSLSSSSIGTHTLKRWVLQNFNKSIESGLKTHLSNI